ncbi:MAG: hypothetical protein JWL59_1831 [Chthoniobacteraceae bacterium]|nr:hypothetical protein [Chthoniobacteraceae bacterium]
MIWLLLKPEKKTLKRIVFGCCLALVVALATPLLYRAIRHRRAEAFLKAGTELARQSHFEEAIEQFQAALQLEPAMAEPLRRLAQVATEAKNPRAITYWLRLLKTPHGTQEDAEAMIECTLRLNRLDIAERELNARLPGTDGRLNLLAAQLNQLKGEIPKAIVHARSALHQGALSESGIMSVANLLVRSSQEADREEGANLLLARAATSRTLCRLSSEIILKAPQVTQAALEKLASVRMRFADETIQEQIAGMDLSLRRFPGEKNALISKFLEQHPVLTPAEKATLGAWLTSRKRFIDVLALGTAKELKSEAALLFLHVNALESLWRFEEIDALLQSEDLTVPEWTRQILLAHSCVINKRPEQADEHWEKAKEAAAGNPQALRSVAHFADEHHYDKIAAQMYWKLSDVESLTRFLALCKRTRDLPEKQRVLSRLAQLLPADLGIQNDLALNSLLLGDNSKSPGVIARRLSEEEPLNDAFRTTYALSCLRAEHPDKAIALVGNRSFPGEKAPAIRQAIYAAILGANGFTKEAKAWAHFLPRHELAAEELELIRPWL